MKILLKIINLLILNGLCCFIYVLIHEFGHAIFSLLFGGKILEVSLLPTAYVLTDMRTVTSEYAFIFIGFAGVTLPIIISIILNKININGFYWIIGKFFFETQNIANTAFSIIVLIAYINGTMIENNDMMQMLKLNSNLSVYYMLYSVLLLKISIINMVKIVPISISKFEALVV